MAEVEKKEEFIVDFNIEELQRKASYRYIKVQFREKIDAVDSKYELRLIYDDSIFDRKIDEVWRKLQKAMGEEEQKLLDNTKDLQKEAADEVAQIEADRKLALEKNPDILFAANRYETKESAKGTIVKFMVRDKHIISLINEKIEILGNYKIWLTGV